MLTRLTVVIILPYIQILKHIVYLSINVTCTCVCVLVTQLCPTQRFHGLWPARLLCPWNSPGKNTGVCCHFLLQGIYLTQGSNTALERLFTIWANREILYVSYISIKIKSLKIAQEDKLFLEMTRKDSVLNFKRARLKRALHKKWGEYLTMRLSQFNSGNKHLCNTAVTRHQASANCKGV